MGGPIERFLTTGQVAGYCGVNFRTVIRWIKKGYLQANRLPGRGDHRISESELIHFLKENDIAVPAEFVQKVATTAPRILIVEDDLPLANSIQRILKLSGYETKIAEGGFEAGLLLSSFQPVVMTLDIHMQGMDGVEVLKVIKKNEALDKVKILIISGDSTGRVQEAMQLGAHAFIAKPFQRADLLKIIDELIQK